MIKVLWTGPGRLEIVEAPAGTPGTLAAGHVRIRVTAAGVCTTDLHIWEGRLDFVKPPLVLGHEFAGVVEQCGAGVNGVAPGSRVKCDSVVGCGRCEWCSRGATQFCPDGYEFGISRDGAWTEHLVVPARNLHLLPDAVSDEVAAILDVEVIGGLRTAGVNPGETVAVFGAGPAGLIALQCAAIMGAKRVIVCDRASDRLEMARRLGANETVHTQKVEAAAGILELTGGRGVDLAFEATGSEQCALQTLKVLRPQGRAVFYGLHGRAIREFPIDDVVSRDLRLYGSLSDRTGWKELIELVSTGRLDLQSLITHRFPLEAAGSALETMRQQSSGIVKAVLTVAARQ